MKKNFLIAVLALLFCFSTLFILSGFHKRTDVVLIDFSVQNEETLLLNVSLPSSMGYIRDITTEIEGNAVHTSFFSAFGGLNSDIGARNLYEIQLSPNCKAIYFDRGSTEDALVLYKDAEGLWRFPK